MENCIYAIFVYDLNGSCEASFYFKTQIEALDLYEEVFKFLDTELVGDFEATLYKIPYGICWQDRWETIYSLSFTLE